VSPLFIVTKNIFQEAIDVLGKMIIVQYCPVSVGSWKIIHCIRCESM
jgi:hypothetical protein